jgi:hypothetical protein
MVQVGKNLEKTGFVNRLGVAVAAVGRPVGPDARGRAKIFRKKRAASGTLPGE